MIQYRSACELAHRFPDEIADFLDLERHVRRGRFREETATDLLLAALAKLPGTPLELITPKESETGSDLDIVIVDLTSKTQVGYRLQAKRLSLTAKKWPNHSFTELAHAKNTGSQYKALTGAASLVGPPRLTPLYAFYIPASVCAESGSFRGIQLADARSVGVAIEDILTKQVSGGRSTARRIGELSQHFFDLTDLFCPPVGALGGGRGIATPAESASRIGALIGENLRARADLEQGSLPEPSELTPSEVKRLLTLRDGRPDRGLSIRARPNGSANPPLIVLDGSA